MKWNAREYKLKWILKRGRYNTYLLWYDDRQRLREKKFDLTPERALSTLKGIEVVSSGHPAGNIINPAFSWRVGETTECIRF